MLTGVHILLTYKGTSECDHCFLHCSPAREGTFTLEQLRALVRQIEALGTVRTVYFEGGEPFLYYPVLLPAALVPGRLRRYRWCRRDYRPEALVDSGLFVDCDIVPSSELRPVVAWSDTREGVLAAAARGEYVMAGTYD